MLMLMVKYHYFIVTPVTPIFRGPHFLQQPFKIPSLNVWFNSIIQLMKLYRITWTNGIKNIKQTHTPPCDSVLWIQKGCFLNKDSLCMCGLYHTAKNITGLDTLSPLKRHGKKKNWNSSKVQNTMSRLSSLNFICILLF